MPYTPLVSRLCVKKAATFGCGILTVVSSLSPCIAAKILAEAFSAKYSATPI